MLSREEKLYRQDILNQGKVLAEISRLMLTNVMVYNELGIMDDDDLIDYLDYFIMNLMERDTRVRYVAVLDGQGRVQAHSTISEFGKIYQDVAIRGAIKNLKTDIAYGTQHGEPLLTITTPLNIDTKQWGVLRTGISAAEVQESIAALKYEINTMTAVFSILSLLIVSFGARVLAKPVIRLTRAMDGIRTHGDFAQKDFKFKKRHDELGKLQNSFFWMLKRLWEADQEHKKTLEVLGQTEKMVSIGRLAAGVAHEINNPLGGMSLCFKNLMNGETDPQKKNQLIDAVNEGFTKIKRIVDQLLDYARATVTDRKKVNPNMLLEKVLLLLKYNFSKQDIKLIKDLSPEVPMVMIDENKMAQVVMNIFMNAIHALDGGGTMTVRTGVEGELCIISIEDNGRGIAPEIIRNIFDPFFTTKEMGQGTGLGLSVSRGIVEKHGGFIDVRSQVGQGTTFKIKLPLEPMPLSQKAIGSNISDQSAGLKAELR